MADNISTDFGSIASDDIGGTHYPRTKIGYGADGTYTDLNEKPATSAKQDEATTAINDLKAATRWFAITPGTSNLATVPDSLYVSVAGDLVVRGSDGVDVTIPVVAGQVLPLRPTQVRTGTTATVIGLVN